MNRVTVDQTTGSQFHSAPGPVQVFDESGRLLGHFVPQSSHLNIPCPYTETELKEMRNANGGRALNEILGSLEN